MAKADRRVWTPHRRSDGQLLADLVATGSDFPWLNPAGRDVPEFLLHVNDAGEAWSRRHDEPFGADRWWDDEPFGADRWWDDEPFGR